LFVISQQVTSGYLCNFPAVLGLAWEPLNYVVNHRWKGSGKGI